MELGELLSRGLSLTWRYKSLWLFGVLAALGTGAPRLSGNFDFSFRTSMPPQPWPPGFPEAVRRWLDQNWPLVLLAILGLIAFSLLLQLLALWAQGALILGAGEAAAGRSPQLAPLGRRAAARFLRLIGIMIVLGAPGFLLTLILVLGLVGGTLLFFLARQEGARIAGLVLAFLAFFLALGCLLILAAVMHLWSRLALRAALLEDLPWIAALRRGLQLGLRRIGALLLTWLVLDIGVLAVTEFLLSFLSAIPLLPFTGAALAVFFGRGGPVEISTMFRFGVALIAGALCLVLLSRALMAPIVTYAETVWTLAYRAWAGLPAGSAGEED